MSWQELGLWACSHLRFSDSAIDSGYSLEWLRMGIFGVAISKKISVNETQDEIEMVILYNTQF